LHICGGGIEIRLQAGNATFTDRAIDKRHCSKREWLRRESSDREFSSMAAAAGPDRIMFSFTGILKHDRHVCGYGKTTGSGKFPCSPSAILASVPRHATTAIAHRTTSSAQYFHGIATDADIGNASPFPRRPDVHFAWATALDALPNHDLLIGFCDAVLDHPTGSAACRRSSGWVFATVKKTFELEL